MNRFRFLWSYISQWKYNLLYSFILLIFVSLTTLAFPWLLKLLVDQLSGASSGSIQTRDLILILVVILGASAIFGYRQYYTLQLLGSKLRNALRSDLYRVLLNQSLDFHRKEQVGELSSRVTEDIGKLQPLFIGIFSPAIQNALLLSGCTLFMLLLNWKTTILIIGLISFPLLFIGKFSRSIKQYASQSQKIHARANALLEESLVAIKDIKAFAREEHEHGRYIKILEEALNAERKISKFQALTNQIMYVLLSTILLGIFYAGSQKTIFPSWSIGGVIAFYFYAYTFTMALISVGRIFLLYQGITGPLDRVIELLNVKSESPLSKIHCGPVKGTIRFENISFGYDLEMPVFNGLNFCIDKGSWLLITGPSGCGKSTIANLLLGFYSPGQGNILIDSINLKEWNKVSLRENIGYVGQEPFLFYGTIRDNIVLSRAKSEESKIQEVLAACCLNNVVGRLPNGLETDIGERGVSLSGGEKARIALARALLLDPPILILDEALRTVEQEIEQSIWNHLTESRSGKTTIIMSHHSENIPAIYQKLELGKSKSMTLST